MKSATSTRGEFVDNLTLSWTEWTFCVTANGFFAMVHGDVRLGDKVYLIEGANVTLVLRQAGDSFSCIV